MLIHTQQYLAVRHLGQDHPFAVATLREGGEEQRLQALPGDLLDLAGFQLQQLECAQNLFVREGRGAELVDEVLRIDGLLVELRHQNHAGQCGVR